jgi:hypothetical protein
VGTGNRERDRPLTGGTHLSRRTKFLAETVLALILGRDRDEGNKEWYGPGFNGLHGSNKHRNVKTS